MTRGALRPVQAEPGRPLYETARDELRRAIEDGAFRPGDRIPSTQQISKMLSISLVTAHRALQELVDAGLLDRIQGRGTFIRDPSSRRNNDRPVEVGLIFNPGASLADFYHSQVLEGIRGAATELSVQLQLYRYGDVLSPRCSGHLCINTPTDVLDALLAETGRRPVCVVGASHVSDRVTAVDVDNHALGRDAVEHLVQLGHERIAYVGGSEDLSNSIDRHAGFNDCCEAHGIGVAAAHVVRAKGWQLDADEMRAVTAILESPRRPTAVFAAGYYLALNTYSAATAAGLVVGRDLSVIGVDDPPSGAHLSPPLTTMRQPLVRLGRAALEVLLDPSHPSGGQLLSAELVVRQSTFCLNP